MAQQLTLQAQIAAQSQEKSPNVILKIDGISEIFGAAQVRKFLRFDEDNLLFDQDGLFFDGTVQDENSRDLIDLDQSTTRITQQLQQDKGSVQSITNVKVSLIDPSGELTELFNDRQVLSDILGATAKFSYMFEGGGYPEDSIDLLDGVITDADFKAGTIELRLSHPFQYLRQRIFTEIESPLTDDLASDGTVIPVNGDLFVESQDPSRFETYVQIDDEIIQYESASSTQLSGLTRGARDTIAAAHESGDDVSARYALKGSGVDILLRLLLSDGDNTPIVKNLQIDDFEDTRDTGLIDNAVFFNRVSLNREFGITVGDQYTLVAKPSAPDFPLTQEGKVIALVENESGSYIIGNNAIPEGEGEDYVIDFISEFNTYPIGLGLLPRQVDVAEIRRVIQLFNAAFPGMDLFIDSPQEGLSIINQDLMVPNGLYLIPRKGRISVGRTTPPLAEFQTQTLNKSNIVRPDQIKSNRSINKNFYNSVIYKYDKDELEDITKSNLVIVSEDSQARIKFQNKPFIIEANGFRRGIAGTDGLITRQAEAYLERFRFAAEEFTNVNITLGAGFNIDVGDTVIFGDPDLSISDTSQGDTFFTPRVMEVTNKRFSLRGEAVTLTLLDTAQSALGRFGVISPSSNIQALDGNILRLKVSFRQPPEIGEAEKWQEQVGEKVLIRSTDWSVQEVVTITDILSGDANAIEITTPSITVLEDYVLDIASYIDERTQNKNVHCFWCPQVSVAAGVSDTVFDASEPDQLFIGSVIKINSPDFTRNSPEVRIIDIDADEITVDRSLGFTPQVSDEINLIGFVEDEGLPYRVL